MNPSQREPETFGEPDDLEMEARLHLAALRAPTPQLPPETAALPWSVQRAPGRPSLAARVRHALRWRPGLRARGLAPLGQAREPLFALARLGVTVGLAAFLFVAATQLRVSSVGSPDIVRPVPSIAVSAPVPGRQVYVIHASGTVDQVMSDFIGGGIRRAEDAGAAAVIVQLDTLGGGQSAMTDIVKSLSARIPTIVWVGPAGSKAASAGTYITLAANLAYMAPSTNIGAASPVTAGGGDLASQFGQTEAAKIMADAEKYITAIAQDRHPDAVAWAVSTVQDAKSYSAQEALAAHAINGIAHSVDDVIAQADGQPVTIAGKTATVGVAGAAIVNVTEDPIQALLHALDDPNIAFILLVLGVLCLLVELFHPTLLVGIAGAAALALSFYGSGSLPLNLLGVVLVMLGIGMLVLEPNVPSHGLLAIGGLAAFIVGAVAFYGSPGPYLPAVSVAWPIIATMSVVALGFAFLFVRTALQMRHADVGANSGMVGSTTPLGAVGEVRAALAPVGTVYVVGETWSARSADGAIESGTPVRVLAQEGLVLVVERAKEPS